MAENTGISWCEATFNPWIGCTKVSEGCKHCYAERDNGRFGWVDRWGPQGTRKRTSAENWKKPLVWNKKAADRGAAMLVFCASLADVFEDRPELAPWRDNLFELIAHTKNLVWLLLTKRPENINRMVETLPVNVWIGTSVENQEQANKRLPHLLKVRASRYFVSCEPLLGPVDLTKVHDAENYVWFDVLNGHRFDYGLDGVGVAAPMARQVSWVIVGGESGPNARPVNPDWVRDLRDQATFAGKVFHFKQWGGVHPKSNGRTLDGQIYDGHPAIF